MQQEDQEILEVAIAHHRWVTETSLGVGFRTQFRSILHDYATRLGWIVEYLYSPGPDDTPYLPQQIAYIVINGKLAGSGLSLSKISAADIGCKVVLQELIETVQVGDAYYLSIC